MLAVHKSLILRGRQGFERRIFWSGLLTHCGATSFVLHHFPGSHILGAKLLSIARDALRTHLIFERGRATKTRTMVGVYGRCWHYELGVGFQANGRTAGFRLTTYTVCLKPSFQRAAAVEWQCGMRVTQRAAKFHKFYWPRESRAVARQH